MYQFQRSCRQQTATHLAVMQASREDTLPAAAAAGDMVRVKEQLPHAGLSDLHTALCDAVQAGHLPVVELVAARALPAMIHDALLASVRREEGLAFVQALLPHTELVDIYDALEMAVERGLLPIVEARLPRATPDDITLALSNAVMAGHQPVVELLLPRFPPEDFLEALMDAVDDDDLPMVEALLPRATPDDIRRELLGAIDADNMPTADALLRPQPSPP